jgi:hypothetical protein
MIFLLAYCRFFYRDKRLYVDKDGVLLGGISGMVFLSSLKSVFGAGYFMNVRGLCCLEIIVSYIVRIGSLLCTGYQWKFYLVLTILEMVIFHLRLQKVHEGLFRLLVHKLTSDGLFRMRQRLAI